MAFDPERYVHDADRAALKALKAIPGFSALTKGFMNIWNEPQQKILNMSTRIRLSERQMRKYYDMLPPICEKLGIPVPELYIELDVNPNSYTGGDTHPFIVITSGMLETIPDHLVPTVLAHECGHIACHHVLYRTMGRFILNGAAGALASGLRFGGLLTAPLQIAFYYWMRCSEFSADRAAVLCDGSPEKMQEVCMRLAGWDKDIIADASMEEFIRQAGEYRELINGKAWNKALEFMILSHQTHPLMAIRATECAEWVQSEEYSRIVSGLPPISRKGTDSLPPVLRVAGGAPEGMQACRISGAGSFFLPDAYVSVKSLPGDPPRSASYSLSTEGTQALVTVSLRDPGSAMAYDDAQSVIDGIHASLSGDQGLIEVNAGATRKGNRYIYSIVKTLLREGGATRGVQYCLVADLEEEDAAVHLSAFFEEKGNIGFRDTVIFGQYEQQGLVRETETGMKGWAEDPYDPSFTKGILKNGSEDAVFDGLFPTHPLSEARKLVQAIIDSN